MTPVTHRVDTPAVSPKRRADRSYERPARDWPMLRWALRGLAAVIAAWAIVLAVMPFNATMQPVRTFTYPKSASLPRTECGAPITQAWRADIGWFGYSDRVNEYRPRCQEAARTRLAWSGLAIAVGAVLMALSLARPRRRPVPGPAVANALRRIGRSV
jgi:hypothetical protein